MTIDLRPAGEPITLAAFCAGRESVRLMT